MTRKIPLSNKKKRYVTYQYLSGLWMEKIDDDDDGGDKDDEDDDNHKNTTNKIPPGYLPS